MLYLIIQLTHCIIYVYTNYFYLLTKRRKRIFKLKLRYYYRKVLHQTKPYAYILIRILTKNYVLN